MYNSEIAKLEFRSSHPADYLKKLYAELGAATTILRNASVNQDWAKVGEGAKRLVDCQTALKAYMDETLPK